jgi:hypothetical protein
MTTLTPQSATINSKALLIIFHATKVQTREGCTMARASLARLVAKLGSESLVSYYLSIFDAACPIRSLPRRYASHSAYELMY